MLCAKGYLLFLSLYSLFLMLDMKQHTTPKIAVSYMGATSSSRHWVHCRQFTVDTADTEYTGDTADPGDTGFTGDTADTEYTVDTADPGDTGDTADHGDTGFAGDTADTAFTADPGFTVDTADTGFAGDTADTGFAGDTADTTFTAELGSLRSLWTHYKLNMIADYADMKQKLIMLTYCRYQHITVGIGSKRALASHKEPTRPMST